MVAICGVGMAPLAVMLKEAGYRVTGSDKAAYPPMGEVLAEADLVVMDGFSAAHLEPSPDVVVIGNAVTRDNPEAVAVEERGLTRLSFPAAVARYFLADRESLVVAGTHGKTTTTGMLARALQQAGLEPGYLVGGLVDDLGKLADAGSAGSYFVIEGDEYDSAYFDKGPKFLHYRPRAGIVTSLEFDHADIYRDLDHVKSSFTRFGELLPQGAPLLVCADYPDLIDAVEGSTPASVVSYGMGDHGLWRPSDLVHGREGVSFRPRYRARAEPPITMRLHGEMNVLNALAVYGLCRELEVDADAVREALANYRGAARRQQLLGDVAGVTVIDDFAHHPTAVQATLEAIRKAYPARRIWAVFEPRSNTSRRSVFQTHYGAALATADRVALSAVFSKENDPLDRAEMLSTEGLVADLGLAGVPAWEAQGPDEILAGLLEEVEAGDVVVLMSNGAFGGLPRRLIDALARR